MKTYHWPLKTPGLPCNVVVAFRPLRLGHVCPPAIMPTWLCFPHISHVKFKSNTMLVGVAKLTQRVSTSDVKTAASVGESKLLTPACCGRQGYSYFDRCECVVPLFLVYHNETARGPARVLRMARHDNALHPHVNSQPRRHPHHKVVDTHQEWFIKSLNFCSSNVLFV